MRRLKWSQQYEAENDFILPDADSWVSPEQDRVVNI
jgi:hypothetical protein